MRHAWWAATALALGVAVTTGHAEAQRTRLGDTADTPRRHGGRVRRGGDEATPRGRVRQRAQAVARGLVALAGRWSLPRPVWSDTEGDLDVTFDAFPVLALREASNAWLVAWTHEISTTSGGISTRTVDADTGALGDERVLYASDYENYPGHRLRPHAGSFSVSYHIAPGVADVVGRFADRTGAPVGDVIPVAATSDFEGGDGVGVAYSVAADPLIRVRTRLQRAETITPR